MDDTCAPNSNFYTHQPNRNFTYIEPFILKVGQVHFWKNEDNDKYI